MIDLQDYRAYMVMAFVCGENQEMTQAQKEQLEIIDRAITAEKAVMLMAEYLVKEFEEDTLPYTEFGEPYCIKFCHEGPCECWSSHFIGKAREQG